MRKPHIQHINTNNDTFQIIMALKLNRKKRNELNELFVEGIESIKQALASPRVKPQRVMFASYDKLSDWAKQLLTNTTFSEAIQFSPELYRELSDKDEPAELMITVEYCRLPVEEAALPAKPFIVIFDRPSDHGNLGSLIRSANSFGVDLFVTHGHCVDVFEPKVIRSSLGAVFHTQIAHVESTKNLEEWLSTLRERTGLIVVGTDSTGDIPVGENTLSRPVALVLGNEAKGMSVRLQEIADRMVRIPMEGAVNSLNVACAGSILMWMVHAQGR